MITNPGAVEALEDLSAAKEQIPLLVAMKVLCASRSQPVQLP